MYCVTGWRIWSCALVAALALLSSCNRHGETSSSPKSPGHITSNSAQTTVGQTTQKTGCTSGNSFDGAWWRCASSDERRGSLAGYLDCYVDDQHHALNFDKSWAEYEVMVGQYYDESPEHTEQPIGRVILRWGHEGKSALRNPHRDFGDEWWRQDSHMARLGFVEGYLRCRREQAGAPRWSKSPEYYVARLDDLYNVDDVKGTDAPEYSGSIASALSRLTDHANDSVP